MSRPDPDLHSALFGTAAVHSAADVAAAAASDVVRDRAFWLALGFPPAEDGTAAYTDDDVAALQALDRLVASGLLDDEVAVRLTRAMARSLGVIARAQAEVVEQVMATTGRDLGDLLASFGDVLPDVESLLVFIWRRHLSAALADLAATGDPAELRTQTVGFVDLTGYTTMSRTHPPAVVRHVIRTFEARVADCVTSHGGRVVSTLGDAVLFTVTDPAAAARLALELAALPVGGDELPPVRVGLAHGETVAHHGDVLGPVVNLAARLCEVARPGTVLVDREAAAQLAELSDVDLRRIPRLSVRGYSHLEPWVLRSRDS